MIALFDRMYSGNLTLQALFVQHFEHRIPLPRLAILGLGDVTRWNAVAEMRMSWALICVMALALFTGYAARASLSWRRVLLFAPVTWLLFSPRQVENLLWGWQIALYLAVSFATLSLVLLAHSQGMDRYLLCSVLCGAIASFSFATGLLVWIAGAFQLLFIHWRAHDRVARAEIAGLLAWCLAAAAVFALYFSDWRQPGPDAMPSARALTPDVVVRYIASALGTALIPDQYGALGAGMMLVPLCLGALSLILLRPSRGSRWVSIPLALMLFGLMSLVLVAVGRASSPWHHALTSRYSTFGLIALAGFYLLVVSMDTHPWMARFRLDMRVPLVTVVLVGLVASHAWALDEGKQLRDSRRTSAYVLATHALQSDQAMAAAIQWPDPRAARAIASSLERLGLSVSRDRQRVDELPVTVAPTLAAFDRIVGGQRVAEERLTVDRRTTHEIAIEGWAVDEGVGQAAGGVYLSIDDLLVIPALYGLERHDIARQLENPSVALIGFRATFGAHILGVGEHTVNLMVVSSDKSKVYVADPVLTVDVRDAGSSPR